MVDSPISFLSEKLEKLPITDYLFTPPTSNDDFNFSENRKAIGRKNYIYGDVSDNFDYVYGNDKSDNCRLWLSSTENNIAFKRADSSEVKTTELFKNHEKTNNGDEIQQNDNDKDKTNDSLPRVIRHPFTSIAKTKPTTTTKTTIKKNCKFVSSSPSSFSPTFSKSLPKTSWSTKVVDNDNSRMAAQLRRSPNKRKHSETTMETATNLLSYNYEETSSFTRSCDFEVFDICKRDFRNIQRALSFDDDLLRGNDGNENNQKHNDGNTVSSSSNSPMLISRHRCQNRPTSKSQPSFSRMTSSLEKPRKFKIISPSDELLVSVNLKNHKFASVNGVLEPAQPPLKSDGSLFSTTTISNITTTRADKFYSIGKYWTVDL